jgi:hypothetical protein
MSLAIKVLEDGGRENVVTAERLVRMIQWIVANQRKLEAASKGRLEFDYAGSRVAVKHTEAGEA